MILVRLLKRFWRNHNLLIQQFMKFGPHWTAQQDLRHNSQSDLSSVWDTLYTAHLYLDGSLSKFDSELDIPYSPPDEGLMPVSEQ